MIGGGIKWLASYPKSGNTWARLFLLNWHADLDEPLSPNHLGRSLFCPSDDSQWLWEEATNLKPKKIDALTAFKLRPHVQWFYQRKERELPAYLKTHCMNDGITHLFPFINWDATDCAVYLIRDPRKIAPSLASHMGIGLDEAINDMADPEYSTGRDNIVNVVGSWSANVNSWKKHARVIRAEDLPDGFEAMFEAFGLPMDGRFEKAKEFTRLEVLKGFEKKQGFAEAVEGQEFFGGKRRTLTPSQLSRIEETHEKVMREFGYL